MVSRTDKNRLEKLKQALRPDIQYMAFNMMYEPLEVQRQWLKTNNPELSYPVKNVKTFNDMYKD